MTDYESRYPGDGEDVSEDYAGGGVSPQPRDISFGGPDDQIDSKSQYGSRDYEKDSLRGREKDKGCDKEREKDLDRHRDREKTRDRDRDCEKR